MKLKTNLIFSPKSIELLESDPPISLFFKGAVSCSRYITCEMTPSTCLQEIGVIFEPFKLLKNSSKMLEVKLKSINDKVVNIPQGFPVVAVNVTAVNQEWSDWSDETDDPEAKTTVLPMDWKNIMNYARLHLNLDISLHHLCKRENCAGIKSCSI